MKRTLSFILTLVMVIGILTSVPVAVSAADESDFEFYLNEDRESYSIRASDTFDESEIVIPATYEGLPVTRIEGHAFDEEECLESVVIPDSVVEIGGSAFMDCINLEKVVVPDSVKEIGSNAFQRCESLKAINIPEGVEIIEYATFYNCESLESIVIPNSVRIIDEIAFQDCESLKSIIIPDGVISIRREAFRFCRSLESVTIADSVKDIGDYAFYGCYNISSIIASDNIETIGVGAFSKSEYFSNPDNSENGVYYIGKHVAYGDMSLLSGECKIKEGTKSILNDAFSGCDNLTSITIPDSVVSIGVDAFSCYNLVSINVDENNAHYSSEDGILFNKDKTTLIRYPAGKTDEAYSIPNGVERIEDEAFSSCEKLSAITIPDSVTSIGNDAFYYCGYYSNEDNWENGVLYIGKHLIKADQLLSTGCDIKTGTKTIAEEAFRLCENLFSITIPYSVTSIGDSAFEKCDSLSAVNIPGGVTYIGRNAFSNCESLSSVQIHGDIETMGDEAFAGCDELTTVIINGETNIGDYAFADCVSLKTLQLNDGVKTIGDYSFGWCENIDSLLIPDSLTSIGDYAFICCYSIRWVQMGKGVKSIGEGALAEENIESVYISDLEAWLDISFEDENSNPLCDANLYLDGELVKDLVIPDGVKKIGDYAFLSCESIETVTIPDSVTSIGKEAFLWCYNLNGVYIEDLSAWCKIDFADEYANPLEGAQHLYLDNELLTEVVIPEDVTQIGDYTFNNCYHIESITIHENVTSIGKTVLDFGLYGLTSINVDKNNKYYSSVDGILFNKDKTTLIRYPMGKWEYEYKIPDSVTKIGEHAFDNCYCLERVEISGSVKNIGDSAFNNCYWLTSLKIAEGVENIGAEAFFGCYRLSAVTIPSSVTDIGRNAFGYFIDYDVNYEEYVKVNGFTIYGVPGTAAETYAIENGFNFIEGAQTCYHSSCYWVVVEEATVYGPGEERKVCEECREILDTYEIPQLVCSKPSLKSASNSGKDVKLSWGSVRGADYYYVYRKVSGGSYSYIGKTTKTSFTDDGVKAGKTYTYKVRAKNEAGYSEYSSTKTVKHLDQPSLKTAENTTSGVKISWGKVSSASGYKVYRKTSDGWKYLGKTSKTYYTDKTAKSGKKYTYSVSAYSGDYNSSKSSDGISLLHLADPELKTASSKEKGIVLKWSKVTGAQGYQVYRKTGSGKFSKIATVKGNSKVTYTDKKAAEGKTYTYKIRAYKSKTTSAYSNTKKIKDKY